MTAVTTNLNAAIALRDGEDLPADLRDLFEVIATHLDVSHGHISNEAARALETRVIDLAHRFYEDGQKALAADMVPWIKFLHR